MPDTIHLPTRLIEVITKDLAAGADAEKLTYTVLALLYDCGWHASGDCPECTEDHCPDEADHYSSAAKVEAIQMLHQQAHHGPREPLDARRCTREPCVTVGGGLVSTSDARGLFAPGSRVVA